MGTFRLNSCTVDSKMVNGELLMANEKANLPPGYGSIHLPFTIDNLPFINLWTFSNKKAGLSDRLCVQRAGIVIPSGGGAVGMGKSVGH